MALAACSSSGIPAATTASVSVSVTQTAPSVWSAPDTVSTSAPGADGAASTGTPDSSTLPGLTEGCSAAIRAQLAVNDLFTEALQGQSAGTSATPTASSATSTATAGITAARVAEVFGELSPTIPAPLSPSLAALHQAATSIVGAAVTDIPAVLEGPEVTKAMTAFGDYIASCEPPPSD